MQSREVDLSHQMQALEFEDVFIDTVLSLGGGLEKSTDPITAVLQNILISPRAAKTWIELCNKNGLDLPLNGAHLLDLVRAAVQENLSERLDGLFEQICERGADSDDGYSHILDSALTVLRKAMEVSPERMPIVLQELPLPQHFQDLGVEVGNGKKSSPLTRAALETRITSLHDRAVRMLCRGREDEAIAALESIVRARINPFYALWNLAVIYATRENFDLAEDYYYQALALTVPETEVILERELAVCYLHAQSPQKTLDIIQKHEHSASWNGIRSVARRLVENPQEFKQMELPALRKRPVIFGESVYHDPDIS
jgi:tetratricopeptide (TPR) repeat protein